MATSPSALTNRLSSMLAWCLLNQPQKRRHPLPSGLVVVLYVEQAERHVLLSRANGVAPSAREAQTVVAHWPEPTPAGIAWEPVTAGRFNCLAATWTPPLTLEGSAR